MPYSQKVADHVCEQMATGRTLRDICREKRASDASWPTEGAIRMWAISDTQGFAAVYARARELQAEALFDQMLEDATTPLLAERVTHKATGGVERVILDAVERSKLKVDAVKWALARLHPAQFGDRMAHQALDPDGKRTNLPGNGPFRVEIVG